MNILTLIFLAKLITWILNRALISVLISSSFFFYAFDRIFLKKWTWHLCHITFNNVSFIAFTSPLWASDIIILNPNSLLVVKYSKKFDHEYSLSLSLRSKPMIFIFPFSFIPIAIWQAYDTTLLFSLTFMYTTSTIT